MWITSMGNHGVAVDISKRRRSSCSNLKVWYDLWNNEILFDFLRNVFNVIFRTGLADGLILLCAIFKNYGWSMKCYVKSFITGKLPTRPVKVCGRHIACCWLESVGSNPYSMVHGANMEPILGPTGTRWDPCWPHELCYMGRYSVVLLSCGQFSEKSSWKTPHSSPARARYRVSYVNSNLDLYSVKVSTMMHVISCYFGPVMTPDLYALEESRFGKQKIQKGYT